MCHTCLYLESEEVKHISFTLVRGTEYSISSFSDSGTSYDPRLEDVDIQFHASLCAYKRLCWGLAEDTIYVQTQNNYIL